MKQMEVIAVFDIGKTNKKLFLYDHALQTVFEKSVVLPEIVDEDNFPSEDINSLSSFVVNEFDAVLEDPRYLVKGVNFSAYGASLVYLDQNGKVITPLYNYLKPYPKPLQESFYSHYGGENEFSRSAASPVLGSLNSGMQLYRLKYEQPEIFKRVVHVLHLPQYLSWLITGKFYTELTSIGCHTNLWNFDKQTYQQWLSEEGILTLLPEIVSSSSVVHVDYKGKNIAVGIGLHDSSSALIPYLKHRETNFMLLSTGTWCISLNPFNHSPLTEEELKNDCLCYLQSNGNPVKAARYFGGHIHQEFVQNIATHFSVSQDEILTYSFIDEEILELKKSDSGEDYLTAIDAKSAYFIALQKLVKDQKKSIDWVLYNADVDEIIVDGGFAQNKLFMQLLGFHFPEKEITASTMHQGSSLGAAMVLKEQLWKY
ncbi:MAG: carbohydrate kinase [Chitinophagaceae bacterium]|nr:carbohydrate kinase [Chitinophagaceae bacterium]